LPSTRALIHAPWSASKVSTALRCPRLFHFKYVQKLAEPEVMPEARIGKAIHKALEQTLMGAPLAEATGAVRGELPTETEQLRFDALAAGIPAFTSRTASSAGTGGSRASWSSTRSRCARPVGDAVSAAAILSRRDHPGSVRGRRAALVDHATPAHPGYVDRNRSRGLRGRAAAAAFRHVRTFWLACTGSPSAPSSGARRCRPR
jgi:hypothetical protein